MTYLPTILMNMINQATNYISGDMSCLPTNSNIKPEIDIFMAMGKNINGCVSERRQGREDTRLLNIDVNKKYRVSSVKHINK